MTRERWWAAARAMAGAAVVALLVAVPRSAPPKPWRVVAFRDGRFTTLSAAPCPAPAPPPVGASPCPPLVPPDWHVTAFALADVTFDASPECVLLVWRPWEDWPIQEWLPVPSPVAGFHDAAGESCHLILLDPRDGRELWAGSALPAPLLALAVGDVDGDGRNEVVTLEGNYEAGRGGPATHLSVWQWNGFGFTLEWRSSAGILGQLVLTDADNDGILDVATR